MEYGTTLVEPFFYTTLVAETLRSVKSIQNELTECNNCDSDYTAGFSRALSKQYSESVDGTTVAALTTSECLMGSLDYRIMGRSTALGSLPFGVLATVFGWFIPGQGAIPITNLTLQSNCQEAVDTVSSDNDALDAKSPWALLIAFMLTALLVFSIAVKATYCTNSGVQWKSDTLRLSLRLFEGLRVVAIYVALNYAVYLETNNARRTCGLKLEGATLETPFCKVVGEKCEFQCTTYQQNYTIPVAEHEIDYTPPWKDLWTWANFLGILYLVLAVYGVIVEARKAHREWKQLKIDPEQVMEGDVWIRSQSVSYQRASTA